MSDICEHCGQEIEPEYEPHPEVKVLMDEAAAIFDEHGICKEWLQKSMEIRQKEFTLNVIGHGPLLEFLNAGSKPNPSS